MEFMGFHIVDIVIVSLVAFLAIKGLVNGFSKELLSFISIVAGILLAARYNLMVVELINEQKLFPPIPPEFAEIIGFIAILITVWLVIGFISSIISKLTGNASGFVSRLLGYILSAARYVFIFSLIIFGLSQSEFFKKSATKFTNDTQLFKPMSELGATILNIDVNETAKADSNTSAKIEPKNKDNKEKTGSEVNLTAKSTVALSEDNTSTEKNASN